MEVMVSAMRVFEVVEWMETVRLIWAPRSRRELMTSMTVPEHGQTCALSLRVVLAVEAKVCCCLWQLWQR